mmetsp:Transcript_22451/g.23382  ORF Transcript_22451/g.23382 Transcript_22451/m.23382 type:complete len:203 (+) Transcript_22451:21-629(+)
MIKASNTYIKRKPPHYTQLINVWIEEPERLENVKKLMLTHQGFKLDKLKLNPVYKESYDVIVKERDTELEKLDKSLIWSRRYQKKDFYKFVFPFSMYCFILIPYIFYKVLHRRIYEHHVKSGYDAENLKPFNYWNIDFENKDLYPASAIRIYFDLKKIEYEKELEKEKVQSYSDCFVKTITHGYVNDMISRRQQLGFDDEEE